MTHRSEEKFQTVMLVMQLMKKRLKLNNSKQHMTKPSKNA